MVETPFDDHDSTDPNGSNDFPPLVPIMVDRNNTILWLWGLSESDFQQGVVTGPSFAAENNKENSSIEASTLQNVMKCNTNLTNMLEKGTTQTDLSVEGATTNNFNILAMAATAASLMLPRVPERLVPPFTSPNPHILALSEINLRLSSSPLTEMTNNFSLSENRSSSSENRSESIPLSTTNARYQAASDGAYLMTLVFLLLFCFSFFDKIL
jgi:hypothetical protein